MAELSGWGAVGYGLAGGYERDRRDAVQKQALEASKAGYELKDGKYSPMPGSDQSFKQQEFDIIKNRLDQLNKEKIQTDTWNVLDESVESGDYENVNRFINKPDVKPLFESLGVKSFENFNPNNKAHMEILSKGGVNPDFIKAFDAINEDNVVTPEELQAIQKAYPVVRVADGSLQLGSLEDMVAMTGRAKSTYNKKNFDNILDTIAQGKNAFKGITKRLFDAKVLNEEATASKTKLELDDMNKYLEENPKATLQDYKNLLTKNDSRYKQTAQITNLEYEAKQRGITVKELLKLKDEKNLSKTIQKEEYMDSKDINILKASPTGEMYDVDYNKLDNAAKLDFNQKVSKELKNLSTNDAKVVDSFNAIQDSAKKIKIDDLSKVTGVVDATFSSIMDTLGIDRNNVDIENETQMAVIRNVFVKAMSGSQVTGNEWERLKAQLGTNFKADNTASSKLGNALQESITSLDRIKVKAPAYYAKHLKDSSNNLSNISKELKSFGAKSKTGIKVAVGTTVKGPDGNLYKINSEGKPERINQ